MAPTWWKLSWMELMNSWAFNLPGSREDFLWLVLYISFLILFIITNNKIKCGNIKIFLDQSINTFTSSICYSLYSVPTTADPGQNFSLIDISFYLQADKEPVERSFYRYWYFVDKLCTIHKTKENLVNRIHFNYIWLAWPYKLVNSMKLRTISTWLMEPWRFNA